MKAPGFVRASVCRAMVRFPATKRTQVAMDGFETQGLGTQERGSPWCSNGRSVYTALDPEHIFDSRSSWARMRRQRGRERGEPMIIPIGHDETSLWRLPIVTFTI